MNRLHRISDALAGEAAIEATAYATASGKQPYRIANVVFELTKSGVPVDEPQARPVTTQGSVPTVIFVDVGPGKYEVTATFMQGSRVESKQVSVEVGEPRRRPNPSVFFTPLPVWTPGGGLLVPGRRFP
jgi:hypothetical protein